MSISIGVGIQIGSSSVDKTTIYCCMCVQLEVCGRCYEPEPESSNEDSYDFITTIKSPTLSRV